MTPPVKTEAETYHEATVEALRAKLPPPIAPAWWNRAQRRAAIAKAREDARRQA